MEQKTDKQFTSLKLIRFVEFEIPLQNWVGRSSEPSSYLGKLERVKGFQLAFSTGWDSATFWDKDTEVPSLSH